MQWPAQVRSLDQLKHVYPQWCSGHRLRLHNGVGQLLLRSAALKAPYVLLRRLRSARRLARRLRDDPKSPGRDEELDILLLPLGKDLGQLALDQRLAGGWRIVLEPDQRLREAPSGLPALPAP